MSYYGRLMEVVTMAEVWEPAAEERLRGIVRERDGEIERLQAENDRLQRRVFQLEAQVDNTVDRPLRLVAL